MGTIFFCTIKKLLFLHESLISKFGTRVLVFLVEMIQVCLLMAYPLSARGIPTLVFYICSKYKEIIVIIDTNRMYSHLLFPNPFYRLWINDLKMCTLLNYIKKTGPNLNVKFLMIAIALLFLQMQLYEQTNELILLCFFPFACYDDLTLESPQQIFRSRSYQA